MKNFKNLEIRKFEFLSNLTRVNYGNNFVIKVFDLYSALFTGSALKRIMRVRRTVVRVLETIEPILESIIVSLEK